MTLHIPTSLLLPNLPKYQALFSSKDRAIIADSKLNIVIITEPFNYQNFRTYYERYQPDYLLPSDMTQSEAKGLIQRLSTGDEDVSLLQKDLIERFRKNIIVKLGVMFSALDNNELADLQSEAHKIAGSALCYGYKSLGDIAREIDIYLDKAHPIDEVKKTCCPLLRKMLFAYQKIST